MNRTVAFLLSLSILLPLITGMIRYRKIPVSYHPFLYLLGIGFANEIICFTIFHDDNAIPTNIYLLSEYLFFTWQFHAWKNIMTSKKLFWLLMISMTVVWVIENIIIGQLNAFSPVFQVGYSLILVLLVVNQLNWLIVNEKGEIIKHPIFIICIAVIIFFSYKILTEIFYHFAPERAIKNNIFVIQSYINVGYNVLLALAIICIPQKRTFTLPSR